MAPQGIDAGPRGSQTGRCAYWQFVRALLRRTGIYAFAMDGSDGSWPGMCSSVWTSGWKSV